MTGRAGLASVCFLVACAASLSAAAEGSPPPGDEVLPAAAPPRAWTFVPSIGVTENFSDNVFLAPRDRQSGFYTTWVPGLAIRGNTRRLQLGADWAVERLMFADEPSLDRTTQQLHGNLGATILDEHLFVDAYGALYPSLINGAGRLGNLSRNVRTARASRFGSDANRTNVTAWGVTPRWRQEFGSVATFTASSTFSDTSTDTAGRLGAGAGREWRARLETGRNFQRWHWGIGFERRETDHDNAVQTSTFERLLLDTRFDLTRKLALTGAVGLEDNQFVSSFRQRNGVTWQIGFDYEPTPRTSLIASVGERSFGETKAFALRHRLRSLVLSARYDEDLRTTSELLRARAVLPRTDAFGEPLPVDPTGNLDGGVPFDQLSLVDDVFVNRVFSAGIGYQRRRDQVSVNVYRVVQGATRSQRDETAVGTGVLWRHQLGRQLSGGLQLDYQTREAGNARVTTDFTSISPFLQWQLGPSTQLRLNYSWMESASSREADSFRENALMLGLSFAF